MDKNELDSIRFIFHMSKLAFDTINVFIDSSDYNKLSPSSYSLIFGIQDKLSDIMDEADGLLGRQYSEY